VEFRRHHRVPLREPVTFHRKDNDDHPLEGLSTDISLGGMFIETATPEAFKTEIVVHLRLPGERAALALAAIVRWTGAEGMGVQFGLLGAKETHAITEFVATHRKHE